MCLSPGGGFLVVGTDDGRIIRYSINTKEKTILYQSDGNGIYAMTFNSNGTKIAFGDKNGTLKILDSRTSAIIKSVPAHASRIVDIEFSPDDKQIATASIDKSLRLWDANNLGNKPVIITEHNDFVLSVAFSPDGKNLVSSADQRELNKINYIYIWPAYADYMAEIISSKLERNFTTREWELYVSPDIEYRKTCPNK